MLRLNDIELNFQIPCAYGIGCMVLVGEKQYRSVYEGTFPRKVLLDLTTWRGMTEGALHFYGCLKIPSLKFIDTDGSKTIYPPANAPRETKGLEIALTRPVTKRDLAIERGERFKGASLGERIRNFDSREQVKAAAVEFFKTNFSEGWCLVAVSPVANGSVFGQSLINEELVLA